MVTQRIANPSIPVRFWAWPPKKIGNKYMIDKVILKMASNTDDYGVLDNYSHYSYLKNSSCGDDMKIYLSVKTDKIKDFKYQGNFCIYCQASAGLLSKKMKNKPIKNVKKFLMNSKFFFNNKVFDRKNEWKDFEKIMNKKNIARKNCLLFPIKTLLKALNN